VVRDGGDRRGIRRVVRAGVQGSALVEAKFNAVVPRNEEIVGSTPSFAELSTDGSRRASGAQRPGYGGPGRRPRRANGRNATSNTRDQWPLSAS
jgi:hypothetical protein